MFVVVIVIGTRLWPVYCHNLCKKKHVHKTPECEMKTVWLFFASSF